MTDGPIRDTGLDEALISAFAILSLLHHRGLIDSERNRGDVALALAQIEPFARDAERRAMAAHGAEDDENTDENTEEMIEELSRALYATLHGNGFDYFNTAQALIDNGWRKVMVTHDG